MDFIGYGSRVTTTDENVTIEATNFASIGALGGKRRTIAFADMTGLDWSDPTGLKNGTIVIGTGNGRTVVFFLKKHADAARALHAELAARNEATARQSVPGPYATNLASAKDFVPGLGKLSMRAADRATAKDATAAAERVAWFDARPFWKGATIVGRLPSDKASAAVEQHAGGESPWFAIGSGDAGVLAAWDDRLIIVKTGGKAAFMAGATGGGRIATFAFHDITGIEYNSGWVTGVLEVLTPSYQGSRNQDYWRGAASNRNNDAGDPWTLSNTLPLGKPFYTEAAPHLEELRKRIGAVRSPQGAVAKSSVAEELSKLAQLRDAGILSENEFADAKARLLSTP